MKDKLDQLTLLVDEFGGCNRLDPATLICDILRTAKAPRERVLEALDDVLTGLSADIVRGESLGFFEISLGSAVGAHNADRLTIFVDHIWDHIASATHKRLIDSGHGQTP